MSKSLKENMIEEIAKITLLLCAKSEVDVKDVVARLGTLGYNPLVDDNTSTMATEHIEEMKEVGLYIPDFMEQSVDVLGLFPRTRNALCGDNITTLGKLLVMSKTDIAKIPGMGAASMRNLKECLHNCGFALSPKTLHEQKAEKFCLNPYVRSKVAELLGPLNYKLADLQYFSDDRIHALLKRGRISKEHRNDFITWVRGGCQ